MKKRMGWAHIWKHDGSLFEVSLYNKIPRTKQYEVVECEITYTIGDGESKAL